MFGFDQRERLLREEAWTAQDLAMEVYLMIGPDVPNKTEAPVQVQATPGVAPYQLTNYTDGDSIFQITRGGEHFGDISIVGGNLVFTDANGRQSSGGGGETVPVWG